MEPDEEEGYWEDRGGYRAFVTAPSNPSRQAVAPPPEAVPAQQPDSGQASPPGTSPWGAPPPGFAPREEVRVPSATDPVAIVAFVFGFISVFGLPLGAWARARVRRSGAGGAGLATAAMVLSGLWAALIAFIAVLAVVSGDSEEPVPGATAVAGTSLKVGQCLIGVSKGPDDLSTVPCSQSHDAEVFAVFPIGSPTWPGAKVIEDKANSGCSKRFESYVGRAGAASGDYDVEFYYPVESAFQVGRRSISCTLVDVDRKRLIGSAKA